MESRKRLSEIMKDEDIFYQVEIRIGPFKLLNQIGKGKFSSVFLGIHEETEQKVAIKQINKSELNTDNLLIKEINILKILFHPYLTQMYCVIEKSENIFIITEYCSKGDIISYLIENDTFDESSACKIFQQIISSLEYLHKNNICHRDIKPENILLTENLDAKLSDFGLSKYFKKNELLNTSCGSPIYAAPEMLQGKSYDGTKIDIWSLGISLYMMISGELPFSVDDENDIKTLIDNVIKGYYKELEYMSPECKDLIRRMLETNPEKRITLEEIKRHKWINMFQFNFMKSPGIFIDNYLIPVDIYLVKDICGNDEDKIRKLIKDILDNKHNENTINYYLKNNIRINKGEKSVGDLRPNSEMFLNYINSEISQKKYWENDIKKVENYYLKQVLDLFKDSKEILKGNNKDEKEIKESNNKIRKKNNLEIINSYIGPLIFIHDIIDEIISKVILIKNKKNKQNNFSVSSTSIMEIKNKRKKPFEIKISKENNIDIKSNSKEKNKEKFIINKINDIELISVNKFTERRCLSYTMDNEDNQNIIKDIDLNSKNKNISDIKQLQINVIENEIIINDINLKNDLENKLGLTKNYSQNYSYDMNNNCFIKVDSNNKSLKNKKKENKNNINNKIYRSSRLSNKSVDLPNKKNIYQKSKAERIIKHNILMSNYKRFNNKNNNINTFIKTSFNTSKKENYSLFKSPKNNIEHSKNNINKYINNDLSNAKLEKIPKKIFFPVDVNKNNIINHFHKYNNYLQKEKKEEINQPNIIKLITPKKEEIKVSLRKNMKNKIEENQLIKTTVSLDKIREVIKKYVGNNVVENNDEKNFKFICKTKIGKDEINFYLELISINFDTRIFKGTLIQGETRLYKELLLKIKEKLS